VLSFLVRVLNSDEYCANDIVTLQQAPSPSSFLYYLGNPTLNITSTFSHSLPDCELDLSLT